MSWFGSFRATGLLSCGLMLQQGFFCCRRQLGCAGEGGRTGEERAACEAVMAGSGFCSLATLGAKQKKWLCGELLCTQRCRVAAAVVVVGRVRGHAELTSVLLWEDMVGCSTERESAAESSRRFGHDISGATQSSHDELRVVQLMYVVERRIALAESIKATQWGGCFECGVVIVNFC